MLDPLIIECNDFRVGYQLLIICGAYPLLRCIFHQVIECRYHKGAQVLSPVPDHHCLLDILVGDQGVLDILRGDILPAGSNDDVFLPVGQAQEPVIIDKAHIPCPEPTVRGKGLFGGIALIVISFHDLRACYDDLSVFCNADIRVRERTAYRAEREVLKGVHRHTG